GKVPSTSLSVLVYMALKSVDSNASPWSQLGYATLATEALGRGKLKPTGDAKVDKKARDAMERAVERAIAPLSEAGAITTERRSADGVAARYRLWLKEPSPHGKRGASSRSAPHGNRGTKDGNTPRKPLGDDPSAPRKPWGDEARNAPRKVSQRPTESVP